MKSHGEKHNSTGPLEGVRIVEFGIFHAGPGANAILGDMGADVIKIEYGEGDPERFWTRAGGLDFALPNGGSLTYEVSNRNKRGIYLNIDTDKGREVFHRLIEGADVFLTNLRKSTKAKMGLDYQTISKINPQIIHANVSGYGPEGPMNDLGSFDPLGQGQSGMMYLTGDKEPALIHMGVLDQATAIAASHAILTALFVREHKGYGQEVHVSLYSTALWLLHFNMVLNNILSVDVSSIPWDRSVNLPLRNCFKCKDGEWILGTNHPEDKYWPAFCEITGRMDLLDDPRFADTEARVANCTELIAIFDQVFLTRTRDEWMQDFLEHGLMFCSVQHLSEVNTDVQALANDYVVDFHHPRLGTVKIPGYPVHFSAGKAYTRTAAPELGEHTDEVLAEIGLSEDDIHALRADGVIR